ncbi:MAG TPA: c-type cytochrome [Burkholderiales bacterium]|nr:c-type cytochrome [Burkholderiales bacterium]
MQAPRPFLAIMIPGLRHCIFAGSTTLALLLPWPAAAAEEIVFHHAFDESVLDVGARPGESFSDAVKSFHANGKNPYVGDADATAQGKVLYDTWCQGCHMPDGSGHMGPSLIDDVYIYDRVPTDLGLFEVVFAGAGGAMQSFAERMSQDDMLKVVAYIRRLQKKP